VAIFPGRRTAKATQRIGAAMLLLAFLLPLLACVVSGYSREESSLPACCRTHGKHQCMASEDITHGTSIRAVGAKCPFCPGALPSLQHQTLSLTRTSRLFAANATHSLLQFQSTSLAHAFERDTTQKRGPPAPLLS